MIEIVRYGEQFDEALKALDAATYYEVKYHGDVLREDIGIALADGVFEGVCYLRSTPSFALLSRRLPRYFLTAVFMAVPESESEVEASLEMLSWLQTRYEAYQKAHPVKRIILRLWCRASDHAYSELLLSAGFRAMEIMPVMVRPLSDEDLLDGGFPDEGARTKALPKGMRFVEPEFTEDFSREYLRVNGQSFGIPDSEAELCFILSGGGRLFTVMKGERLIASVTTWKITGERAATENIFCAPHYRERGITTALLRKVFSELRKEGYGEASLSLFGDNQPAFQLYEKLGYEVSDMLIEMHYETDYEMREY